ncbi:MAG: haloacid dehalogenase [Gammaproteobacteria bacterium]|nr:haloacid dehalogenase [Gammaproteobacteria bacterium]
MKWDSIETFFLDMDGTLLDLSYDNYFWHQHIPKIYAEINNMSFEKAKKEFEEMYKKKQDTIDWYCLNYWSDRLKINLHDELLKTKHKIRIFPGVIDFLMKIRKRNIKIILLTNCPRDMLNVKLNETKLWGYFDQIISSEDYGFAKETNEFWNYLEKVLNYDKKTTIFIDDNQKVLDFAYVNGIKNIISINFPDSENKKQVIKHYKSIDNISLFEKEIIH